MYVPVAPSRSCFTAALKICKKPSNDIGGGGGGALFSGYTVHALGALLTIKGTVPQVSLLYLYGLWVLC
jgi:hypothetical protein